MSKHLSSFAEKVRKETAYAGARGILTFIRILLSIQTILVIGWGIAKGQIAPCLAFLFGILVTFLITMIVEAVLDIADCQLQGVRAKHDADIAEKNKIKEV